MPVKSLAQHFKDSVFVILEGNGIYKLDQSVRDFLLDVGSANITPQQFAAKAFNTLCVDGNSFNDNHTCAYAVLEFLEKTTDRVIGELAYNEFHAILNGATIKENTISEWIKVSFPS